jgi:fused signal recognition particle receptor
MPGAAPLESRWYPAATATMLIGTGMSWLDRLRGGFKKTADRLADNLTGLFSQAALDTATLDDIEEALIASDLGPEAAADPDEAIAPRSSSSSTSAGCARSSPRRSKRSSPRRQAARNLGLPAPHVILVIGVNGSGKTTTIGKLGIWLKEQDYGVLLAPATRSARPRSSSSRSGAIGSARRSSPARKAATPPASCSTASSRRPQGHRRPDRRHRRPAAEQGPLMDELPRSAACSAGSTPKPRTTCSWCSTPPPARTRSAQVEVFGETAGVTGLVMTKLDGTARGGMLVAAAEKVRPADPRHRRRRGRRRPAAVRPARRRPRHCRTAARMTKKEKTEKPAGGTRSC